MGLETATLPDPMITQADPRGVTRLKREVTTRRGGWSPRVGGESRLPGSNHRVAHRRHAFAGPPPASRAPTTAIKYLSYRYRHGR